MHTQMGLTHTDLKPENILLKLDSKKQILDMNLHPIHVQRKREMYDGERVDDEDESSCFSETGGDNDIVIDDQAIMNKYKQEIAMNQANANLSIH